MSYELYTVHQFMQAWFKKDYSELSEDEFKTVYAEYQDTSGLFLTEDFERQSFIYHLNQRINYVKMFIRLQRDFISWFQKPFLRQSELDTLKDEYGYVLKWKDDLEDFEKQLQKIESREIKHTTTLEEKLKEWTDLQEKRTKKQEPEEGEDLQKSRISFIRMLNSLGKIGYKLDKKTTTVEELSLMIKQQMEEVEEQNMKYGR